LGDLNRDSRLDNLDVKAPIGALTNPTGFEAAHGLTATDFVSIGDLDGKGDVTIADVSALEKVLTGNSVGIGSTSQVPEPTASALAAIGAILILSLLNADRSQYTGQMPGVASSTRFWSGSRK
jgi:hypothetical protein